jgi:tRNA(fMet)-specific endonuclease VapC
MARAALTVADTDVLIDYLRGRNPAADRIAAELDRGSLYTTVITRFELLAGARTARELDLVQALLIVVPALPLDAQASDRAARIRRDLEDRGEGIGLADSLIAGIVATFRAAFLTRNGRHFARVRELDLAIL